MIKALATFAVLLLAAALVIDLSLPKAEANETAVLPKSDQLDVSSSPQGCDAQTWPNIATACLHNAGSKTTIVDARLITTRRSAVHPGE